MQRFLTISRATLVALSLCLFLAGSAGAQKRIVGGSAVSIADHPYQVLVESDLGSCGGSIRDATHVLTAAHCVVDEEGFPPEMLAPSELTVGYGATNVNDLQSVGVSRVSVHFDYLVWIGSPANDVAILTLAAPIDLSGPNAEAISLGDVDEADSGFATGWGYTQESGSPSDVLQGVDLPLQPDGFCEDVYGPDYDSEVMVCAGGAGSAPEGNPDACLGDSGGPLAIDGDSGPGTFWQLAGITSFGDGCGRPDTPAAYTWPSAPKLNDWVTEPSPAAPPVAPGGSPVHGFPTVYNHLTCGGEYVVPGVFAVQHIWYLVDGDTVNLLPGSEGTIQIPPYAVGSFIGCARRFSGFGGFDYIVSPPGGLAGPVFLNGTFVPGPPAKDTRRPRVRVRSVKCNAGRCTIKISASDVGGQVRSVSAKVSSRVRRCRRVGGRKRCKRVTKTRKLTVRRKGSAFTIKVKLKKGAYKLSLRATDTAGNRAISVKRFRVRAR